VFGPRCWSVWSPWWRWPDWLAGWDFGPTNPIRPSIDVQRILDTATGTFHDDFAKRSPAFVDVVKKAQSKSQGTITEAGLESGGGDQGQVLVAVSVKTSTAGAAEPQPHAWRMRISVERVGDGAKVSNVEFVP
jgi:Mce-associated membrane protein